MATFTCSKCGLEKEARCKPQKCPNCGEKKSFEKTEEKTAERINPHERCPSTKNWKSA